MTAINSNTEVQGIDAAMKAQAEEARVFVGVGAKNALMSGIPAAAVIQALRILADKLEGKA